MEAELSEPYRLPLVSLVMPGRNEEKTIRQVIWSVLRQDYPHDRMEFLFVDGMSTDSTRRIVEQLAPRSALGIRSGIGSATVCCRSRSAGKPVLSQGWAGFPASDTGSLSFRVIANPQRTAAAGLNAGIAAARGEVIVTLGAHSEYSPNYVSGVVARLQETGADAVGSVAVTVPGGQSRMACAIAAALSSKFGVGNSMMRVGVSRPQEADTASCPGYRRTVFDRIGWFNTGLVRNQDIEFNLRLRRAGGRIVLDPEITTFYRARARLRDVVVNSFQNGYWIIRAVRIAHLPFSLRHLVPLLFVGTLLLSAVAACVWTPAAAGLAALSGCYIGADLLFAVRAGVKHGRNLMLPLLAVFPALHLSYGFGSFWALLTVWFLSRPTGCVEPIAPSRRVGTWAQKLLTGWRYVG
ncbi:MAG: glycosyltransferase family 2 protein [candidate division WOR-3 bacterium]